MIPLSYRSISLISCVSKLMSSVLNNRIQNYCEVEGILCDEQNAYRKKRSCDDHLFTLTSIIRNRKHMKLPTYACYVDFSKAFDSINYDCLWFKLLNFGIHGKMLNIIKAMYRNVTAQVKINGVHSGKFPIKSGVRQGDNLSPTLFSMYLMDLRDEIQLLNKGFTINGSLVSILLYADDIVLLSDSPEEIQAMLDKLAEWCKKWRMIGNSDKTQVMHLRRKSDPRTTFQFKLGNDNIEIVENYRYLGLCLNEHLDFTGTVNELYGSASRALGGLIAKHLNVGLNFKRFSKLFKSTVAPIMNYGSCKNYDKCNVLIHRAMRTFMRTGKYTAIPTLFGEMG